MSERTEVDQEYEDHEETSHTSGNLPEHQYSRQQLIDISNSPLSRKRPKCLDPAFDAEEGKWDPERWYRAQFEKPGEVSPLTLVDGKERRRIVELDRELKRRPSLNDPIERLKEERDKIILSPQRRSFVSGCHVQLNTRQLTIPDRERDREEPRVEKERDRDRDRDRPVRKIGSGRIIPVDRENSRDFSNLRDRFDERERDVRDREPDRDRDRDFTRNREREWERDPRERDPRERDPRDNDWDRDRDRDRRFGGSERFRRTSDRDRDFDDRNRERRDRDYRDRGFDRNVRRRNNYKDDEKEPEWFTGGPSSQSDFIELRGFDREGAGDTEDKGGNKAGRINDSKRKSQSTPIEQKSKKVSESSEEISEPEAKVSQRSSPEDDQQMMIQNKIRKPPEVVLKSPSQQQQHQEEGALPPTTAQQGTRASPHNSKLFDFDEILKASILPLEEDSVCHGSRFSRFFSGPAGNKVGSEASSIEDLLVPRDLLDDSHTSPTLLSPTSLIGPTGPVPAYLGVVHHGPSYVQDLSDAAGKDHNCSLPPGLLPVPNSAGDNNGAYDKSELTPSVTALFNIASLGHRSASTPSMPTFSTQDAEAQLKAMLFGGPSASSSGTASPASLPPSAHRKVKTVAELEADMHQNSPQKVSGASDHSRGGDLTAFNKLLTMMGAAPETCTQNLPDQEQEVSLSGFGAVSSHNGFSVNSVMRHREELMQFHPHSMPSIHQSPAPLQEPGISQQASSQLHQQPGLSLHSVAPSHQQPGLSLHSVAPSHQQPGLSLQAVAPPHQQPGFSLHSVAPSHQQPGLSMQAVAPSHQPPGMHQPLGLSLQSSMPPPLGHPGSPLHLPPPPPAHQHATMSNQPPESPLQLGQLASSSSFKLMQKPPQMFQQPLPLHQQPPAAQQKQIPGILNKPVSNTPTLLQSVGTAHHNIFIKSRAQSGVGLVSSDPIYSLIQQNPTIVMKPASPSPSLAALIASQQAAVTNNARIPSPLMFSQQPPLHLSAPSPIHPSQLSPRSLAIGTSLAAANVTSPTGMRSPVIPRVPSPQEISANAQAVLQSALIKRHLQEQSERYQKKQQERTKSPSQQHMNVTKSQPVISSTPTSVLSKSVPVNPFTPTSVLRKMHSDKAIEKEKQATIESKVEQEIDLISSLGSAQNEFIDSHSLDGMSRKSDPHLLGDLSDISFLDPVNHSLVAVTSQVENQLRIGQTNILPGTLSQPMSVEEKLKLSALAEKPGFLSQMLDRSAKAAAAAAEAARAGQGRPIVKAAQEQASQEEKNLQQSFYALQSQQPPPPPPPPMMQAGRIVTGNSPKMQPSFSGLQPAQPSMAQLSNLPQNLVNKPTSGRAIVGGNSMQQQQQQSQVSLVPAQNIDVLRMMDLQRFQQMSHSQGMVIPPPPIACLGPPPVAVAVPSRIPLLSAPTHSAASAVIMHQQLARGMNLPHNQPMTHYMTMQPPQQHRKMAPMPTLHMVMPGSSASPLSPRSQSTGPLSPAALSATLQRVASPHTALKMNGPMPPTSTMNGGGGPKVDLHSGIQRWFSPDILKTQLPSMPPLPTKGNKVMTVDELEGN